MVRPYRGVWPTLGEGTYVDPSAQVIGAVALGDDSSIWMNTVIRGDVNSISVGARTNVQDNCVLHVTASHRTELADDVTVGHSVSLHGCTIGAFCLIGIGAIILNGAEVGEESLVAAGSLVAERMRIPKRSMVMGAPARVVRAVTEEEIAGLRRYASNYVGYKNIYLAEAGAEVAGRRP